MKRIDKKGVYLRRIQKKNKEWSLLNYGCGDPKEDPKEELEVEAEEDAPPAATLPVGSPITPPPLSESSSDTEAAIPIVSNGAFEMPPTGSLYEVGGPSSVSSFPPFYLHGREIARLDDNNELLLSNEEPGEESEEDPEEELEVKVKDDVHPPATPSVGSPITPLPLSESSSDTEDVAPIVANKALEMPLIGSTYEVGGPSSVFLFPPLYLHGCKIARLDDNTELLLSNVKYLKRCEKKRKAEMEASSSEIRKVKKCMHEIGQDLGDEMQFSNLVENRVTKLEDKDQDKAKEMEKIKKRLGTLKTNYSLVLSDQDEWKKARLSNSRSHPWKKAFYNLQAWVSERLGRGDMNARPDDGVDGPASFGESKPPKPPGSPNDEIKAVKKMVKKRIAKAIEEYEKTRANPGNASGSGAQYRRIGECTRRWIEKVEQVFEICKCAEEDKKKIKMYMKGFPERIKGNITSLRPITLHDAINLARESVEQAVQGKAARVNESNKRKWEEHQKNHPNNNNPKNCNRNNNNQHHQMNRRQETGRAYAAILAEGRGYNGNLPWCHRCKAHHQQSPCPPKCNRCNKPGHQEKDCRVRIPATGGNTLQDLRSRVSRWKVVSTNTVLRGCTLALFSHVFKIDLLPTRLGSFDVIIGMDWLSYHRAVIVCYEKIFRVPLPNGEILEIQGERPKKYPKLLSCIKADEKRLDDIRIVRDFPEVFPDDLTGLPPVREIEFRIDLILGVLPVVKSPYRLAHSEMLELSNQLKELQAKGFIRPSHSPWGAPVLFIEKNSIP
nr:putative reverse transcriptase domain-containing protein [Tanacetum cinerariifolium]